MPARVALYARCSTADQNPEAQLAPLRAWAAAHGHDAVEYVDAGVSGARASRPALDAMMGAVRRGEVQAVAVAALDRLGRDVANLLAIAGELRERGVPLTSLREGIDLHSPIGKALFTMLGLVAELERSWIKERTMAGLESARRRGVKLGRRHALDDVRRQRLARLVASGISQRRIAELLGCSKGTVAREVARLREHQAARVA